MIEGCVLCCDNTAFGAKKSCRKCLPKGSHIDRTAVDAIRTTFQGRHSLLRNQQILPPKTYLKDECLLEERIRLAAPNRRLRSGQLDARAGHETQLDVRVRSSGHGRVAAVENELVKGPN